MWMFSVMCELSDILFFEEFKTSYFLFVSIRSDLISCILYAMIAIAHVGQLQFEMENVTGMVHRHINLIGSSTT